MPEVVDNFEDELLVFDRKLKQLKLDYDQYFLGSRPREPVILRRDVQKFVAVHSQMPITNTGQRFRFSSLCARFQAMKRQWDETLRKIETGTYERHQFKARLHGSQRSAPEPTARATPPPADLFEAYLEARRQCGQSLEGVTAAAFEASLAKQQAALRERHGSDVFGFRVVVEDGAVKLKAFRSRNPG